MVKEKIQVAGNGALISSAVFGRHVHPTQVVSCVQAPLLRAFETQTNDNYEHSMAAQVFAPGYANMARCSRTGL